MTTKIYVASSWRNGHQQNVVAALRGIGFEVYDFKNPNGEEGFKQTCLLPQDLQQHVLDGGLLLMEDIVEYCSVHGAYNKLAKALKDLWEAICYHLCKLFHAKGHYYD